MPEYGDSEYESDYMGDSWWAHQELIRRVRSAPNWQWINSYLNLMKELLEGNSLTIDDPRLLLSMPKTTSTRPYHLPMSINNRYVLDNKRRSGNFSIRFIYGPDFDYNPQLQTIAKVIWRYQARRGEYGSMSLYLQPEQEQTECSIPEELKEGWLEAAYIEANRDTISNPKRNAHQCVVYRAAIDLQYRDQIMTEAFDTAKGGSEWDV